MINLRWAIGLGVAGLLLSLVIGLFSGVSFPQVFVRAGIMGCVFFALGCGLWLLINNFIPELLFTEASEESEEGENESQFEGSGSRVNITIDEPQNLPEIFRNLDHGDEVGNIMDLVTGTFKPPPPPPSSAPVGASFGEQGIDQNPQDGYTGMGTPDFSSAGASPASTSSGSTTSAPSGSAPSGSLPSASSGGGLESPAGSGPDVAGGLGDLEGMAGFFSGPEEAAGSVEVEEAAPPERRPTGNKAEKMDGDFNPKDLAMGIRTVLSKDE